jgi:lysozyme family protein
VEEVSPIDLAAVVLDTLDRIASDRRAISVAKRAGLLLTSLSSRAHEGKAIEEEFKIPPPPFDASERSKLKKMFEECVVDPRHKSEISKAVNLMIMPSAKKRYQDVSDQTKVPWYVIAALHYREANLNFFGHLHNGDRLDQKTHNVPKRRPFLQNHPLPAGAKDSKWPPIPFETDFAWRLSAADALTEFENIKSWTVERMLFGFEQYNGFGYRPHHIDSPYVWSYSQYYHEGGFPCDGCWSGTYISKQAGLGLIVKAISIADPAGVLLVFES